MGNSQTRVGVISRKCINITQAAATARRPVKLSICSRPDCIQQTPSSEKRSWPSVVSDQPLLDSSISSLEIRARVASCTIAYAGGLDDYPLEVAWLAIRRSYQGRASQAIETARVSASG